MASARRAQSGGPAANPDLADFKDNGAAAESLAIACEVIAETLAALGYVKQAVDALGGGNPAAALAVVSPVMQQIDRLTQLQANSRYPSAFSIGKMLLMLTGDAQANPAAGHEADKLAALLGANSAADVANAQSAFASSRCSSAACSIARSRHRRRVRRRNSFSR